jgi:hypothetical protein
VKELLPNALDVSVEHPRGGGGPSAGEAGSRVALEPGRLFATYYQHRHGAAPPPELRQLFDALYDEATR